jgi:hypothetical protein
MAIDERYLDSITLTREAVTTVSKKRKRIRPWESHLVPTTSDEGNISASPTADSEPKTQSPPGMSDE